MMASGGGRSRCATWPHSHNSAAAGKADQVLRAVGGAGGVVVRAPPMQSPSITPKLRLSDECPPLELDLGSSPTCSSPSPPAAAASPAAARAGGSVEDSRKLFWGRPSGEEVLIPKLAFDMTGIIDQTRSRVASCKDPCFHHPKSPLSHSVGTIPEHDSRRTRNSSTGNRRRPHRGACGAVPAVGSASVLDRAVRLAELDGRRRTESAPIVMQSADF